LQRQAYFEVASIAFRDEIKDGSLVVTHKLKEIWETFYAITPSRKFPNPIVAELIHAAEGK
jgi:LysR family transcriptional activator of nhaA